MPYFRIARDGTSFHGTQTFLVKAKDAVEAAELGDSGDAIFESEEVEFMALDDAEVIGEVTEAEFNANKELNG